MINESESHQPGQPSAFDASFQATNQSPVEQLLAVLEIEYAALLTRLSAYLRSPEAAAEALHDVYVKLRGEPSIGDLYSPRSYLYRMAINLAKNRGRHEALFKVAPVERIDEIPDDRPDPEQSVGGRLEMGRALAALDAMPPQRREIFLARWRDEKLLTEIARDLKLHKRTVQKELARAEHYLRSTLGR